MRPSGRDHSRAVAEAGGSSEFSALWSGQAVPLGTDRPAGDLVRALAAAASDVLGNVAASRRRRPMTIATEADFDAIVVGGGHNGLITAGYLAMAGLSVVVLEARAAVGGTATSEEFAGATVNVCSCDHITLRTTPVIGELELERFGLSYLDLEPTGAAMAWSGGPAWTHWHDVDRTVEGLARTHPSDVEGYRRYVERALRRSRRCWLPRPSRRPCAA